MRAGDLGLDGYPSGDDGELEMGEDDDLVGPHDNPMPRWPK